jgi:hypothetical protein
MELSQNIQVNKLTFAHLITQLFNPNPDDPGSGDNPFGPYGPGGPVMTDIALLKVIMESVSQYLGVNPQPIPPKAHRLLHRQKIVLLTQSIINQVVKQYQAVELMGSNAQSEKALGVLKTWLARFVDDWCATPPRFRFPIPFPPPNPWTLNFSAYEWQNQPLNVSQTHPVDLLVVGAEFLKTADYLTNTPLSMLFAASADRFFEAGLAQIEHKNQYKTN